MAIQIDYFLAADDEAAAATSILEAGPRSESSDVVPSSDVDPGLALGYLNEILTGTSLETYLESEGPLLVATSSDEQKLVLEIDAALVARLAALTPPFDDLAARWSAVEAPAEAEPWQARPADLADVLRGLTGLARRAENGEGAVYCWLWP